MLRDDDEFMDQVFLAIAELQSLKSPDPSTKVGAIITRDKIIVGGGYNAFPARCQQLQAVYKNRERKYLRVVHAEVSAVLSAGQDALGGTLYVWPPGIGPSCGPCSAVIIEAGIERVVYVHRENPGFDERWGTSITEGLRLYKEAKVKVDPITLSDKYEQILKFAMSQVPDARINDKTTVN